MISLLLCDFKNINKDSVPGCVVNVS